MFLSFHSRITYPKKRNRIAETPDTSWRRRWWPSLAWYLRWASPPASRMYHSVTLNLLAPLFCRRSTVSEWSRRKVSGRSGAFHNAIDRFWRPKQGYTEHLQYHTFVCKSKGSMWECCCTYSSLWKDLCISVVAVSGPSRGCMWYCVRTQFSEFAQRWIHCCAGALAVTAFLTFEKGWYSGINRRGEEVCRKMFPVELVATSFDLCGSTFVFWETALNSLTESHGNENRKHARVTARDYERKKVLLAKTGRAPRAPAAAGSNRSKIEYQQHWHPGESSVVSFSIHGCLWYMVP